MRDICNGLMCRSTGNDGHLAGSPAHRTGKSASFTNNKIGICPDKITFEQIELYPRVSFRYKFILQHFIGNGSAVGTINYLQKW